MTRIRLPDALTLSRLFFAGLIMFFLSVDFTLARTSALLMFIIAGTTDYLDGYLARKYYGSTPFGVFMDPLTDKILICAAFVSFVELQLLPAWMVVLVIGREFLVTGLRLLAAYRGHIIPAGRWGKHKTGWQVVTIVAIMLGLAVRDDVVAVYYPAVLADYRMGFSYVCYGLGLAAVMITLASGWGYFWQHSPILRQQ
ncbi:MAG TPA: CDP-diacylglycerol--glycerol-3-phosphate 3-phosphatidyltransferase [Kiritimatiellae bacterium]|nr:CDP-diacylglycerol--glycerol-3-phosphate 3-phosphatidyltransferase [Kiritimatiellia bacterium]